MTTKIEPTAMTMDTLANKLTALCEQFAKSHPKLQTVNGSFDRCRSTSTKFSALLREHGFECEVVQWAEGGPTSLEEHPRWATIPPAFRIHYVTKVNGSYVDWTAKQFDPTLPCPAFYTSHEDAGWREEHHYFEK